MENKIIYVHGLSSSGATASAQNIQALLPQYQVVAPDMPLPPQQALQLLTDLVAELQPVLVVGTSMGAMFTQQLHGQTKILINPAFHVSQLMRKNLGTQPFFNPRKDGVMTFDITPQLCDAYEIMEKHQFDKVTAYDQEHTYGFFGTHDEMVNCQEEFSRYYPHKVLFEGEHRLNPEVIERDLVPLIQSILMNS